MFDGVGDGFADRQDEVVGGVGGQAGAAGPRPGLSTGDGGCLGTGRAGDPQGWGEDAGDDEGDVIGAAGMGVVVQQQGGEPVGSLVVGEAAAVGEAGHAVVDDLAAAFDEPVGVEHEAGARGRALLGLGCGRAGVDAQEGAFASGEVVGGAVGGDAQRRDVSGAGPAQLAGDGVHDDADRGAAAGAGDAAGVVAEVVERGAGGAAGDEVGAQGAAQLAHDRGGGGALADHVTDDDGDAVVVEGVEVVPVPTGLGVVHRGLVPGGDAQPLDPG